MGLRDILVSSGIDSMKQKYVGVAVRLILTSTGVTLAGKTDDGMVNEISGALIVLGTAAWSMYEKRQSKLVTVTALGVAQISENEAKALVASPAIPTPPVTTPPNVVPVPVPVSR